MKALKKISGFIDKINTWVGTVSSYSVLILMLIIVWEVFSRKVLNSPTIWGYEVILFVYGFLIMMVAGFGLLHNVLVKVDLVTMNLSERTNHILAVISFALFFLPFVTLLVPACWKFFYNSFIIKEGSWSQWGPAIWPIKFVMPVSMGLLWLQGISEILKHIIWLKENPKGAEKKSEEGEE